MFLPQKKKKKGGNPINLMAVMGMYIALIVVMVSRVYADIQTHQNVHIKYILLFFVY